MEHRELRCTEHLSKYEKCPNVPESVRQEALQRLATKRGLLSSVPIDELGTPSNPHVVGDDNNDANANDGAARKRRKAMDGSTTKWKRGAMDTFVDRGLSKEERALVDLILLRYAYSAATCVNGAITHHQSNCFFQQPMADSRGSLFHEFHSGPPSNLHTTIKANARGIPSTSRGSPCRPA